MSPEGLKSLIRKITLTMIGMEENPEQGGDVELVAEFVRINLFNFEASSDASSQIFFMNRENGALCPEHIANSFFRSVFEDVSPLDSTIDLSQQQNVSHFLYLKEAWEKNNTIDLFYNTEEAPYVQANDFGAPGGFLFVGPVKFGWWRTKWLWQIATSPFQIVAPLRYSFV